MWPVIGGDCWPASTMSYGGRSAGSGSTGGEGRSRGAFPPMYAALEKHRCLLGGGICQVPGGDEATPRMTRWPRLAIPASGAGQFAPGATSNYLD
jgi:hypothetical protein